MKYPLFILSLILVTNSLSAGEIMSFEKRGEKLMITADTCQEIEDQVSQMSKWNNNGRKKSCTKAEVKAWSLFGGDGCEANISECLPKHVTKYHGSNPDTDGPNCWNLSLVMSKILPNLRYSSPEEMQFYMQPPLCRSLANGEKRMPGDVGAIRNSNKDEVHGFIYVTDKIAYSKNGFSRRSPYELQKLEDVYDVYEISSAEKEKCLQNRMDPSCKLGVEYFRCISMPEYLKQEEDNIEVLTKEITQNINRADCYISQMAFNIDLPLEKQTLDTIKNSVLAITEIIQKKTKGRKIASLSEPDAFIIASTKLRVNAIKEQIELFYYGGQYSNKNEGLINLHKALRNSQRELDEITK